MKLTLPKYNLKKMLRSVYLSMTRAGNVILSRFRHPEGLTAPKDLYSRDASLRRAQHDGGLGHIILRRSALPVILRAVRTRRISTLDLPALLRKALQAGMFRVRDGAQHDGGWEVRHSERASRHPERSEGSSPVEILRFVYLRMTGRPGLSMTGRSKEPRMTKRKKAAYVLIGLLLVAGVFLFLQSKLTGQAIAAWFDEGWQYRKAVALTNTAATQTNVQVMLTLDTTALVTAGKLQSTCADFRVTDKNAVQLNFWLEPNTCNTATTKLWVKVPALLTGTGTTTVYVYYGNASASSSSSSANTFIREVSNVQAAWDMDEASWNGTASEVLDSSGNGIHGTASGAITKPTTATGNFGNAGTFAGTGDYVSVGVGATAPASLSVSAFIKPTGVGGTAPGGTIVAKGTNYSLSLESSVIASGAWQSRTAFTTNAITTQLSGTAVVDTYYYDTTKDNNYGDGSANDPLIWRFDSTKSWYSETKDHTYAACNVATDDRCGNSEFPEKSYIVATATNVYIYDAQENAMWMRFDKGATTTQQMIGQTTNSVISSIFALNGEIYVGANGTVGELFALKFKTDTAKKYNATDDYDPDKTIVNRNTTVTWTAGSAAPIVNTIVNDVHAAVIASKTYVAVATGVVSQYTTPGGVSVINETDGTVTNYSYNGRASAKVFITSDGNLYYSCNRGAAYEYFLEVQYNFTADSGSYSEVGDEVYYYATTPALRVTASENIIDLYVTKGTSTVDGTSNTIYVSSVEGINVIQEKQGAKTSGSVKYFTKDYITEEMVGDIRGMWSFSQNATLAGGDTVPDDSYRSTDLTSAGGATVVNGVRGKAFSFNGTYLQQKAYLTGAQTERNDTAGSADITLTGLATYKTTSQPYAYMIVSTNCTTTVGWGYLGATISGDQTKVFSTRTGTTQNWAAVGSGGTCDTFEVRKSDFQITGNLTVGAWVKRTSGGTYQGIISKWMNDAVNSSYQLVILSNDHAEFRISKTGANGQGYLTSTNTISTGDWHHIVATYQYVGDGSSVQDLYVDGAKAVTQVTTAVGPLFDSNAATMVGAYSNPAYSFNGTIDEPFVTATALTADEIKRMYEVGKHALTAAGTNTLNGTSNQVNAVAAGGLFRYINASSVSKTTTSRLFAGTAGGGVSEIDLGSDTLVNYYTNATTPAINSATVNSLSYTSGGGFVAGLSSGTSRLNDVSGKANLSTSAYTAVAGVYDKSTGYYNLYENSTLVGQTNVGTAHSPLTNTINGTIGGYRSAGSDIAYPFYGLIDNARLYTKALSAAEITDLQGNGSNRQGYTTTNYAGKALARVYLSGASAAAAQVETSPGSPGPVAYWKFDDGTGTNAQDSSSNNNDGTLTGVGSSLPTWQTEDMCVSGKCLKFDGTSDYVDAGNNASLNITGSITTQAWVKFSETSRGLAIINKDKYMMKLYTNNSLYFGVGSGSSHLWCNTGKTDYQVGTWYHVAATYDGTTAKVYVNGALDRTCTLSHALEDSSGTNLKIGYGTGAHIDTYFHGLIDDVKIYPYARTAAQVKADYASRGSSKGVSLGQGDSLSKTNALSNGLVGYWKMDEPSWNGTAGEVLDASGNGNNGVGVGSTKPTTGAGKFGNGGVFDGTDDYVDAHYTGTLTNNVTFSSWVYLSGSAGGWHEVVSGLNGAATNTSRVLVVDETKKVLTQMNIGGEHNLFSNTALTQGSWYLVTYTYDGAKERIYINGVFDSERSQTGNLASGSSGPWFGAGQYRLNGKLDDLRIYNRALSPAEVRALYNFAPGPVRYLKMEEGTGTSANDSSGNGGTGTVNNGTWTTGKYGKGVKLNGSTGSDVSVPDFGY